MCVKRSSSILKCQEDDRCKTLHVLWTITGTTVEVYNEIQINTHTHPPRILLGRVVTIDSFVKSGSSGLRLVSCRRSNYGL